MLLIRQMSWHHNMTKTRVAINGFGRIGRSFFRKAHIDDHIEVVAINDLGDIENLAYLLRYDTAYGHAPFEVATVNTDERKALVVDGREIAFLGERDPAALPWGEMQIDVVLESTGFFTGYEKSQPHRDAGAKRVVISAPVKDEPPEGIGGATVLIGVNEHDLEHADISSNASCTTNASSPLISILHEGVGIEKAVLNTVHGYTASQSVVDSPNGKEYRLGRAAGMNIVPTSTGAAIAVTKVIPDLEGAFDGIAMRVPVVTGSIVDVTFIAKRDTSVEEVNELLRAAAADSRWSAVFGITEEPLVSSDIVGAEYASLADLSMTRVIGGNLVKVLAWYDNEAGYVKALVEHVCRSGRFLQHP
jgi:glyceraldehyde 3-phosphate dehydrogenase